MRNDPEGTVRDVPRRAVLVTWEGHLDVATELFRVVVVSREPVPVTTVLRFKVPGCLPVAVPSVDEVGSKLLPEAIVLVDLGDGGTSLAATRELRQRGIRHGIVAIGNAGTGGLSGVTGLQPPFQLDELGAAMQRAREHSARVAAEQEEGPAATEPVEEATQPPVTQAGTQEGPPIPPSTPATTSTQEAAAPTPGPSDPDQGRGASPQGPAPDPIAPPPSRTPVRREASTTVPQVALDAVTSVDESLFSSKAPAHPGGHSSGAGTTGEPLRSKVDRWRRKLTAPPGAGEPAEPTERELHERLVQIFAATSQIESIAAELPIVTDRVALYQAIVMAVADEFTADTVALWRRAHNGWVTAAHRGLTEREASLPVGFDQPVLRDVDARSGAVLLDPTASFQHLISGIGGAHTESFMAASIATGPNRLGILAVGRDEPLAEADLDRLVEMAAEAAVGIGVAEHIERMSTLVGQMGGGGAGRNAEPGEWRDAFFDELNAAWHERLQGDSDADAGLWSALAPPDDQDTEQHDRAGGDAVNEPDSVIDLTSRATKRA